MLVKNPSPESREFTSLSRIYVTFTNYDSQENFKRYQEIMTDWPPNVQLKLNIMHLKIVKIQQPKFRNWKKKSFLNKLFNAS